MPPIIYWRLIVISLRCFRINIWLTDWPDKTECRTYSMKQNGDWIGLLRCIQNRTGCSTSWLTIGITRDSGCQIKIQRVTATDYNDPSTFLPAKYRVWVSIRIEQKVHRQQQASLQAPSL